MQLQMHLRLGDHRNILCYEDSAWLCRYSIDFMAHRGRTFTGTASDVEDGDLTAGLSWVSSLDGPIGSGGSFATTALSAGSLRLSSAAADPVAIRQIKATKTEAFVRFFITILLW